MFDSFLALEKDHMYSNGRIINTPIQFLPHPVFPGMDQGAQQSILSSGFDNAAQPMIGGGDMFGSGGKNGDISFNEMENSPGSANARHVLPEQYVDMRAGLYFNTSLKILKKYSN